MERSKDKQEHIYFMAAPSRQEAETSPFVERLLRKGYEVLYMVDPVDEYTTQVRGEGLATPTRGTGYIGRICENQS